MFEEVFSLINMQTTENWLQPGLCHYLIISLFIFLTGLLIAISNRNLIKILIGLSFMLNSSALNFIASSAFISEENAFINAINLQNGTIAENFAPIKDMFFNFSIPEGQTLGLIITVFTIINLVCGLALALAIYNKFKNINLNGLNSLKSADCPDYDDFKTEDDI